MEPTTHIAAGEVQIEGKVLGRSEHALLGRSYLPNGEYNFEKYSSVGFQQAYGEVLMMLWLRAYKPDDHWWAPNNIKSEPRQKVLDAISECPMPLRQAIAEQLPEITKVAKHAWTQTMVKAKYMKQVHDNLPKLQMNLEAELSAMPSLTPAMVTEVMRTFPQQCELVRYQSGLTIDDFLNKRIPGSKADWVEARRLMDENGIEAPTRY